MRIRKNAKKLSTLMFSHASTSALAPETLQTHVCQLNQSPWDVITFPPDSTVSCPTEYQAEGDDSVTANGSLGDSIGAVESVASMKISLEAEEKPKVSSSDAVVDDHDNTKAEKIVVGEEKIESQIELKEGGEGVVCCNKADGKGWQCRREAKEGHSLCEHHLTQLRSYNSCSQSSGGGRRSEKAATAPRRHRARPKKSSTSSNPYEFYYYSGFGPLWGKKRGGGGEESDKTLIRDVEAATESCTPSSSSQIDNDNNEGEFDFVDDEDDEENVDGNGDSGRKRTRKPVKARSLKSLM